MSWERIKNNLEIVNKMCPSCGQGFLWLVSKKHRSWQNAFKNKSAFLCNGKCARSKEFESSPRGFGKNWGFIEFQKHPLYQQFLQEIIEDLGFGIFKEIGIEINGIERAVMRFKKKAPP